MSFSHLAHHWQRCIVRLQLESESLKGMFQRSLVLTEVSVLTKENTLRDISCSAAVMSRQDTLQNSEMHRETVAMQNRKADGDLAYQRN